MSHTFNCYLHMTPPPPPTHTHTHTHTQFKQLDVEEPRRSPFLNKKMVSEMYLPHMLTKVH